ncbi:MAG: ATP-binding cassette domain-containing protein [Defluviitaleaceae bacterium]|nr:ATP-binding cassette domain-containing protein [Defluviitaleaceae bacterium]
MSLLKITNLTHAYGDNTLLKDITFDLFPGEKMGLVGLNGSGKSTLLKILTGELIHEAGDIAWRPKTSVGYLDQYRELDRGLSVRQYLQTAFADLYALEERYNRLNEALATSCDAKTMAQSAACLEKLLSAGFYELDSHIDRVAAGLGVAQLGLDKEVAKLSGGQRAKVILAKLLLERPDVLIMDEPTNFLDKSHIEWLTQFLKDFKGAFIVVSHHFDFLDAITNCICEIEFQSVEKYKGNLTAYLGSKDMRRQQYIKNYISQQKWIEKTEDYISRNKARASTAGMAKSRQKMLDRVDRLTPPKDNMRPAFKFKSGALSSGYVLTAADLLIGYEHPLLPKISFNLDWGKKMAITGFNGIGKTTLVRTLLGEIPPLAGASTFHEKVQVGYFQQEYAWGDDALTPYSYIAGLFPSMTKKEVYTALAQAGIGGQHTLQRLSTLSGGEQAKVRICRLSLLKHNLLVLDEPTNHLDVTAKEVLRQAIAEYGSSVIVISHEKSFAEGIVDVTVAL